MRGTGLRVGAIVVLIAAAACMGRARKSEPVAGPTVLDQEAEKRGQLVFMEHCQGCHPNGAGGLGPPLNNVELPEKAIELKVRAGHPVMPAFPEKVIDDDELDDLLEYLQAMKQKEDGRG